ncbi:MAG TPA: hypothetical protein VNT22_03940 [Baekduia sp.]|nr:hypothetical protein [Baekduia sp.]
MRNRLLHTALSAFCEEAAWQLASDAAGGEDELEFEIDEIGGARKSSPLYCYRPLTGDFIDRRQGILSMLPSFLPAIHALQSCGGLDGYLLARGENRSSKAAYGGTPRGRAEEALRCLLSEIFEDSSDFVLHKARFESVYDEFETLVMDGRAQTEVIATIHGLAIASQRVDLGEGLVLVRANAAPDAPAEALHAHDDERPPVLAELSWESAPGDEAPLRHAHVRLRRLLLALRLYDATHIALGRTGWQRTGGGSWVPFALTPSHSAPVPVRGVCAVPPQQEDELRAFISLVFRRTPKNGELAWAMRRFELACDRPSVTETLTDVLLALRALLEPEGAHSGHLPDRLAVLCAIPEQRAIVAERVSHLASIERSIVAGVGPSEEVLAPLVDELTDWLRALLRDVICGHLGQDLYNVADEMIAGETQSAEPEPAAPSVEPTPEFRPAERTPHVAPWPL